MSEQVNPTGMSARETELIGLVRAGEANPEARVDARAMLERMWEPVSPAPRGLRRVVFLAAGAAVSVKLPALVGMDATNRLDEYASLIGILVMPWVFAVFAVGRNHTIRMKAAATALFVVGVLTVRLFPFTDTSSTRILSALHIPVVLWLAAGAWRAGTRWRDTKARLEFVRLTGDVALYFALSALAGGLLTGLGIGLFSSVAVGATDVFAEWIVPCGAAAAFVAACWVADTGGSAMNRVVGVLQRAFTPMFAALMTVFVITALSAGLLTTFDRDRVMLYDALLITVTALAAYGIARGPVRTRWDDRALLAMTCAGVAVDVLLLASMVDRTTGLGVSPNRLAATGLNVVLLVNLGVIAVLQWRMLRGRGDGPARWLGNYLGVLAAWAAVVAFAFPVVFAGQ